MKKIGTMAAVLLAVMLLGSSFLATENARAWDASVSVGPTSVTEGDTVTFSVTVQNTGSDSMKITYVWINFDWLPEDQGYESSDVPQILASGASYTFTVTVPIPNGITTHTSHATITKIHAEDPGLIDEWSYETSEEYAGSVFVETPPPPLSNTPSDGGSSDNGSPGFTAITAIGAVGIISLVAIMRKKRGV